MGSAQSSPLKIAQHCTILVYPFRHAHSDSGRAARLHVLHELWQPWWGRLAESDLEDRLDDTYFFLPHIRELLFPETTQLPAADAPDQLGGAKWLANLSLKEFIERVPESTVMRLTYRPAQLQTLRPLRLVYERKDKDKKEIESFPFDVDWIDAMSFPQGVGFLLLKVRLGEDVPTVKRLNDFLRYLRLVHAPNLHWPLASWSLSGGRCLCPARDMIDFLLQGLAHGSESIRPALDAFLQHLHATQSRARYTSTRYGQVYGQVFHLYGYACLSTPTVGTPSDEPGDGDGDPGLGQGPAGPQAPANLFTSPAEQALYELATCTDTSKPDFVPHPSFLENLWQRHLVAFWENWQGIALHDNVVFLGVRDCGFPINTLPYIVESDYFYLYLLTLFQKTRLSLMSGELVRRDANLPVNLSQARQLWDAFVMFQNRYWYTEVTRKPQGAELYRRFQHGLEAVPLYQELAEQSRELQAYYERRVERSISQLITVLTFVGVPLGILASAFGGTLFQGVSAWQAGLAALVLYGSSWGVWWYLKSREGG